MSATRGMRGTQRMPGTRAGEAGSGAGGRRAAGGAAAVVLLGWSALAAGGRAEAKICTMDTVPAATLLLPYFEVNLDDPNGLTTLFSINNSAAAAVLAHAVIWSDLAVPLFNFDVYLTGYDVQTINLRDILFYGHLPQTADAAEDPNDTISPRGRVSQQPAVPGGLPAAQLLRRVSRRASPKPAARAASSRLPSSKRTKRVHSPSISRKPTGAATTPPPPP
jgi:hypothetical protein